MATETEKNSGTSASSPYRLPGWVLGWFYATAAICTWDASFIVLRPHTLPGGVLHPFWKPYCLYVEVDQRYRDVNDPFVYGISLFNYAEVILNIITIWLHNRNSPHTVPMAFTVSVMTFWKTFFYFYGFMELGGGAQYRVGNNWLEEFILVVVPNGIWIVLPFFVMYALWSRMTPGQLPPPASVVSGGVSGAARQRVANNDYVKGHVREHVLHAKHA